MNSRICLLGLWLGYLSQGWAGLIVVDKPWPDPVQLPDLPHLHHPHRHAFAPLEVREHKVNVEIQDQVAVTRVSQEFYNPNTRPVEGTFLFPLPKGAQIDQFSMEIDGKQVEAELLDADRARKIYEEIVRKQKDPALLEYAGRELLKARIFPIAPHSRKPVRVQYTHLLTSDSGMVQYRYPLNTEKYSAKPIESLSLKLDLETGQPLKSVYSPSHDVELLRDGERRATIGYEAGDVRPDTDFELYFAAEKDEVGLNLLTFREENEDGFFLLLASPGFRAEKGTVIQKDVVFVLDTSGSMAGKKLEQAKGAFRFCVASLNDGDRFELIRFSTEAEPLFGRLQKATSANRAEARDFIEELKATGGTAIDQALTRAMATGSEASESERPLVVIFLTDGKPTVGVTDEEQIVAQVKQAGGGNRRVFCFGVGHDVNTHLLDKITEATRAYSQYVLPEEDIETKVSKFFTKIKEPVLANLEIEFPKGIRARRQHPTALPDLFQGEQLVLAGRYSGEGEGTLRLNGTVNETSRQFQYPVHFPARVSEHEFISRLWATRRVGYLMEQIRLHGENAELRKEATRLARRYGVVTPYTAYLILEDERRRNVPLTRQSLPELQENEPARQLAENLFQDTQRRKAGGAAVARSRYGLALQKAQQPAAGLEAGNREADRGLRLYAESESLGRAVSSASVGGRLSALGRQSQFVGGQAFYQNGKQWIDSRVQEMSEAEIVRIRFDSPGYYELVEEEPAVQAWLALGQNVQFVWDGRVYEIYE